MGIDERKNLEKPGEEAALNLLLFLVLVGIPPVPPPVGLADDPGDELTFLTGFLILYANNEPK